ncbi:MAG TPA: hypothetical protein VFC29_02160, partial [Candidatus Limnocylindrales bacterium]|nr:hypothetical protein [Candidatus Limnocylindrales bacterium]
MGKTSSLECETLHGPEVCFEEVWCFRALLATNLLEPRFWPTSRVVGYVGIKMPSVDASLLRGIAD